MDMIELVKAPRKSKVQKRNVQKKYEHEPPKPKKRNKIITTAVVVILLIVITASIYYFIIPRVELNLKTTFSQGSLNSIYVNTKIGNTGTIDLRDLSINITVWHLKSNSVAANKIENISTIKHWSEQEIKINFVGNQYDSYMIVISIYFKGNTKTFSRTFSHTTNEEHMSQSFEDKIFEIGG